MGGSFWGGMLVTLVAVQILVIWSIRRHRDPSLKIDCESPIDQLMASLSGLTLGTAIAGNQVEVLENGAFSAWPTRSIAPGPTCRCACCWTLRAPRRRARNLCRGCATPAVE